VLTNNRPLAVKLLRESLQGLFEKKREMLILNKGLIDGDLPPAFSKELSQLILYLFQRDYLSTVTEIRESSKFWNLDWKRRTVLYRMLKKRHSVQNVAEVFEKNYTWVIEHFFSGLEILNIGGQSALKGRRSFFGSNSIETVEFSRDFYTEFFCQRNLLKRPKKSAYWVQMEALFQEYLPLMDISIAEVKEFELYWKSLLNGILIPGRKKKSLFSRAQS
jgi:hypothetical protein